MTYLLLPRLHRESPVNEYTLALQKREGYTDQELEENVEWALRKLFSSVEYGYELYVHNAEVSGTHITVMGTLVAPEDCISAEVDRLLLPATA